MHQSFTGALVNCFFSTIFPMFANSISALSTHRIALGLCASFLYASTLHDAVVHCESTAFLTLNAIRL